MSCQADQERREPPTGRVSGHARREDQLHLPDVPSQRAPLHVLCTVRVERAEDAAGTGRHADKGT